MNIFDMKRPELLIVAGHNGSGKTTFAREYLQGFEMPFLNADDIAGEISSDLDSVKLKAGKIFFNNMNEQIKAGNSFALESTLSGRYLFKVISKLKGRNYFVKIVYVFIDSPEMASERIKIRVEAGGHNVPEDDVKRRYYRSRINFWNEYRQLADEWELYYNGVNSPEQIAVGEKDSFQVIDEALFDLFKDGLK
jgi:predicted ABC-type ATPase